MQFVVFEKIYKRIFLHIAREKSCDNISNIHEKIGDSLS